MITKIMQIEAVKEIACENENIKLLLAGEGDKREFLEQKIQEYNLQDKVKLLGYRTDIPRLLKISNLALSTSKREGLPVNVIEALTVGLPVIGTNCRGTRDLIKDGVNGYIVNHEDNTLFCEYIKKIVLSNFNNKRENEEQYLLEKIMRDMKNIYFRKKIVIHVLSSNKYSGAENVACTIIENLKDYYDSYYCCPFGTIEDTLNEKNIKYVKLNKFSFLELKKVIDSIKPDIIHAHDNKASVICSFLKKNRKLISHIHGNNKIMNSINLKTLLFNLCSKKIDRIIWVSESSFNDYVFNKNIKSKSDIIYNVVDEKSIKDKALLYEINEKYDLIFLGRLEYPKNPQRLIQIIYGVKKIKYNVKLAIVGDGEDRTLIEELIKKYKLENNIKLYGFKDNPYPILNNSKLLIMTSIYEGTPMCALEAQSLGKPIVATPVDGLKKIVKNNYNGFLSDSDDKLISNIVKIVSDEKQWEKLSKNTKEYFKKYNDINKYVEIIKKEYGD